MLTASSEFCFGSDRQVASSSRENSAYCERRATVLLDCGVICPLRPTPHQNPVASNRITLQYYCDLSYSSISYGKFRVKIMR